MIWHCLHPRTWVQTIRNIRKTFGRRSPTEDRRAEFNALRQAWNRTARGRRMHGAILPLLHTSPWSTINQFVVLQPLTGSVLRSVHLRGCALVRIHCTFGSRWSTSNCARRRTLSRAKEGSKSEIMETVLMLWCRIHEQKGTLVSDESRYDLLGRTWQG